MDFPDEKYNQFINAAHDLNTLYTGANNILSECLSRWKGKTYSCVNIPALNVGGNTLVSLEFTPFTVTISHIHKLLADQHQGTPNLEHSATQLLKPLNFNVQKLKRKLERISGILSEQIKELNPLLFGYCHSTLINPVTKPTDSTMVKNPTEVEKEVLKIMTSGIIARADKTKPKLIDRMKYACFCGKLRKEEKVLKTCAARLRQLEAEDEERRLPNSTQDSTNVNPTELIVVWQNDNDPLTSPPEIALLDKILSDADAKFFPSMSQDILNDNCSANVFTVLHGPTDLFRPSSSDTDTTNHNELVDDVNLKLRDLIREAENEVDWTISNVRLAEKEFYAPSKELKTKQEHEGVQELKYFVQLVKQAGVFLSKSKLIGMIDLGQDELELTKILGKAFKNGACCLASFEALTSMVHEDATDLEKLIVEFDTNSEEAASENEDGVKDGGDTWTKGRGRKAKIF